MLEYVILGYLCKEGPKTLQEIETFLIGFGHQTASYEFASALRFTLSSMTVTGLLIVTADIDNQYRINRLKVK